MILKDLISLCYKLAVDEERQLTLYPKNYCGPHYICLMNGHCFGAVYSAPIGDTGYRIPYWVEADDLDTFLSRLRRCVNIDKGGWELYQFDLSKLKKSDKSSVQEGIRILEEDKE